MQIKFNNSKEKEENEGTEQLSTRVIRQRLEINNPG